MGTLLNWIDTMFFGVRRLFGPADEELPERPAVKFAGACSVTDDPAENRTVVTVEGLVPDRLGGFTIGTAAGGWVTVRSDGYGFQVLNADESVPAFAVDNKNAIISMDYRAQLAGTLHILDSSVPLPPKGGIVVASVKGALRIAQHSPPVVSGPRGGNAAVASLLVALVAAGIIVDNTTP